METEDNNANDAAQILIVEDSPTQAERLKFTLESNGYLFTAARNGREALAAIQKRVPALVISDIVMPEMNGYQLCGQLKKDERLRNIPVILLTSLTDPIDVVKGLECGADNFIFKPYEERYLLNRITYMLANRHLRENESAQMGVEVFFSGRKFFITSDRLQILNLLLSTYEAAVQRNRELAATRDELRKLNENLEAAVRANQLIMEHSLDVICTIDGGGRFVFVSPACERLWGYTPQELVGRRYLDLVHSDDHPKTNQAAADIMAGTALHNYENNYIRKDGSLIPLVWSASWSAADQLMFCVAHDITERKKAEAAVQQLNDELQRRAAELESANQELEAFSYSVSHDLRAPLRHIDGFTAKLSRHLGAERLDDTSRRLLATIAGSARSMGTLIDDLLAFARISRAEMRRTRVNLDELVAECRHALESEINGRAIAWQVAPLPEVEGDAGLLRQVFANLLSNAVKYTGRRAEARIEIGTQPSANGDVIILVRDNGAGFDMQYAGKLFGVFQRLHASSEFEGTGIGLANVRRIIERHGGRIWAEGAVGQGATFFFSLPAAKP